MKVDIYSDKGAKVTTKADLPAGIFEIKPHTKALRQYVRVYQVNQRAGTVSTKTRSEISGGGRKPWAQKGTGRARHGSIRSPIWVGGGISFGPRPRTFELKLPKKMRDLALKSALSDKVQAGKVWVIDEIAWSKPQTSAAVNLIKKLGAVRPLVLVGEENQNALLSFRNIPGALVKNAYQLNAYDLLKSPSLIITRGALSVLAERLGAKKEKAAPKPVKKAPVVKVAKKAAAPKKKVIKAKVKKAAVKKKAKK